MACTMHPADPQGGVQIHMQVEDGEIMCVKIKEEEIPADISLHGSSERNPPERRLRLQYSHGLKPEKEEERLNIVLVNTDPMIDGDSSYLDNKEEEIPIDFCPVASEPLGTHSHIVKNRTSSSGRASTFSHTRKRPSAARISDSRGYIEVNSLITAVSHQPAIWDAKDPSYMDRLKRSHAWERVCQEVTDDWDDLHTKTKDRRLKDLQTRWRSLKDCYRRELQQQKKAEKSGGPAVKRKTYLYFRQLHFLKPVLEARRQVWKQKSGDCSISGNLRDKTQDKKLEPKSFATFTIPESGATPTVPLMDSPHLEQPRKRRRQEKKSNCTLNSPISSHGVVREHQELEKDADYHFYMYIMAVTKRFSPEKKWAFRMKIMELLQMHSLDQHPSAFHPSHNNYSYTPDDHISPSTYPPAYPHYYPYETSHSSRHSPESSYIHSNQHNSSDPSILCAPPSQPHSPIESPYRSPLSRSSQTPSSQASIDTEGDSSFLDY